MKFVEINWQPTPRQLRQFGFICLIALPLLAWFWGGSGRVITGFGVAGLILAVAGILAPQAVRPVFLTLTILAAPIGMVIGELAMMLIYFGLFLPIGIASRLAGRDTLHLRRDPKAKTYWRQKSQPRDVSSYYRQS